MLLKHWSFRGDQFTVGGGGSAGARKSREGHGLALCAACCLRVSLLAACPCPSRGGGANSSEPDGAAGMEAGDGCPATLQPSRKSRQREPSHPIRQRPDRQTQTQTSAGGSHTPSLPPPQEEEAL